MRYLVHPVLLFLGILGFSTGTMPALAANGFVVEARRALPSPTVSEADNPDPSTYSLYLPINTANATDNAVVGHRIHLGGFKKRTKDNTDVDPGNGVLWCWSYWAAVGIPRPPGATSAYAPTSSNATLDPPPGRFTRFQHFNWYNGGLLGGMPIIIDVRLTINPGAPQQEILIDIEVIDLYAPRLQSLTATTLKAPYVYPNNKNGSFLKDIKVDAEVAIPKANAVNNLDGRGWIGFMQTVTGAVTRSNKAHQPPTVAMNFLGEYVCDQQQGLTSALLVNEFLSGLDHKDAASATAGQTATFYFHDLPSVPSTITEASYQCDFRCFSMYKPDGFGSIWVPVGRVDWDFRATAKLLPNNRWSVEPPAPGAAPPIMGRDCESPPEWKHSRWDPKFNWH